MQGESLAGVIARILVDTQALKFGEFTLSSGAKSSVYVDLRRVLGYPTAFRAIASLLTARAAVLTGSYGIEYIVGVATGGIPWATLVAHALGLPLAYVRPERKDHGLGRRVEGADARGRVLIVDDVATTGSSLISAAAAIRSIGGEPIAALVVVERGQGAVDALRGMGIELHYIVTLKELVDEALGLGVLDRSLYERVLRELGGLS